MKLNCKQGDLAIIVKSAAHNEGKIVRCVRFIGIHPTNCVAGDDVWETDTELDSVWNDSRLPAYRHKFINDRQLRPLRGDLLNDETTTSKELETV